MAQGFRFWQSRLAVSVGLVVGVFAVIAFFVPQLRTDVYATLSGALAPIADGFYTSWAGGYTAVDEPLCNGNVDYVVASSTNSTMNRESYVLNLSSIPTSTITKVTITPCASGNVPIGGGVVTSTMNVFYRHNGLDGALGGNYAVTGTVPSVLSSTVFNGLMLAKTSGTVLEIGAQYAAGSAGVRLSKIAATVNYALSISSSTPLLKNGSYGPQWDFYDSNGVFTDNYQVVQMQYGGACNGTTDYVYTTLPGARDSYVLDMASLNLPAAAIVTALDIQPCASLELCPATNQSGPLTSSMSVFYRSNGVDSPDSAPYIIPVGTMPTILPATTFSRLNLTAAKAQDLEIGAVFNGGALGMRLSGLAARITYIVPDP